MHRNDPFSFVADFGTPKSVAELTTLATLSPFVIASRVGQLWFAMATAPTARDKAEATQMVSEKMAATGEAVIAVQTAMAKAVGDAVISSITGRRQPGNPMDAVFQAGLRPYSKRVRSNHRRLSR
ncbi:hypothetical protein [Jiella mangrovi]|uniref:Antifreeze protein n=1 Tax=Jiella mangrovi TaxID=2821407 RepID=A0ABS4BCY3_9HYPH|nr:hypothetical protein [Jiella mangrovi]MBP0614620.1 hypothetical protein [Jiella mangrovi]